MIVDLVKVAAIREHARRRRKACAEVTGNETLVELWRAIEAACRELDPDPIWRTRPEPVDYQGSDTVPNESADLDQEPRSDTTATGPEDDQGVPFDPGTGPMSGYVAGRCGHRVARQEWRAGFGTCERCPDDGTYVEAGYTATAGVEVRS